MSSGYKNLITWQVADELAWCVYGLTDSFPRSELFVLTSQLRRAALSVVLNIVEGYARDSKNEFRRFLSISLGSLAETDYLIRFSYKRGYIKKNEFQKIFKLTERCGQLLWKLKKSQ